MTLHLLSLDYHQTPLEIREQIAFSPHRVIDALQALQRQGADECAILSTCNRVEILAIGPQHGADMLSNFLCDWHQVAGELVLPSAVYMQEIDAARHLARVACGLESLVPGEMQILGQVKNAAKVARKAGTLGLLLDRLFAAALKAGRSARQKTGIAQRPVSISHAGVKLIQDSFGDDLANRRVLLIGSGDMGRIAAQQLHKAGAAQFIVANRSLERACDLAQSWGADATSLENVPQVLANVDAVISATAAPHYILHSQDIAAAMVTRQSGRGLLLIDLAVPRDIDPEAGQIPGVTLADVDSLQSVVAENLAFRNDERVEVEAIVAEEVAHYLHELAARTIAPTIVNMRQVAEEIRCSELERALSQLDAGDDHHRKIVEAMSHRLMNKLLHHPTVCLREKAATQEALHFQTMVEELFGINTLVEAYQEEL